MGIYLIKCVNREGSGGMRPNHYHLPKHLTLEEDTNTAASTLSTSCSLQSLLHSVSHTAKDETRKVNTAI